MQTKRIWLSRIFIGVVLFLNLQCAFLFLWHPQDYVAGFGVSGAAGEGLVRGMGLLFVMWNVPYTFAFSHPVKRRTSLTEAMLMQAIGLLGETLILLTGDYSDPAITATVTRFIIFDGGGLVLLVLAYLVSSKKSRS
jgi:hypothetical protein